MEIVSLDVQMRSPEERARLVRLQGMIPAVCYGTGRKTQHLSVRYQSFIKAYEKAGKSTIIHINTDAKKEMPVLIGEMQYDSKTDEVIHVDFLEIDLNKEIRTEIPITITGVSLAIKDLAGVLIRNKETLAVSCLPKYLVHSITVDISSLAELHSSLSVKDIVPPEGITLLDAPDINVVTIAAQRAEEEVKPVAAPVEGAAAAGAPVEGAAAAGAAGEKAEGKKEDKK